MNPPEIDLAQFHTSACAAIALHFGTDVEVVAAYPRFDGKIPKRAITIELDGFTPENPDDQGTEQWQGNFRFAAYVFVSFLEENPKLLVRQLAARLAAFVYGQRFGCLIGPAKIIDGAPDQIDLPGKSGRDGEAEDYEVWRVEWSHEAFVGQSVWDDPEALSVEVWSSAQGGEPELISEA